MKKAKLFAALILVIAVTVLLVVKTRHASEGEQSEEATETTTSSLTETTTRTQQKIKKVQIYVDPSLYDATVESESDYVQLYQTTDMTTVVGKVHRGSWVEYLSQTADLIQIRTDDGLTGYIPQANGEISEVTINDAPKTLSDLKIVLDAGHGGSDSGALSTDGTIMEKDLTLQTVLTIGQTLSDAGVQVSYTRQEDQYLALADITAISLEAEPDLFLSIHYDNYNVSNGNQGFTVYYYYPSYETIATTIADQLVSHVELVSNGSRFGNYFVIREQYVPAILIELGYLNSDHDLQVITSDGYAEQVASGLLAALKEMVAAN